MIINGERISKKDLLKKLFSTFYFLPRYKIKKPVFIIAPPRSGSSFLFECLSCFKEFFHLKFEADKIWWKFFPYDEMNDPSDKVPNHKYHEDIIYEFKKEFYTRAAKNYFKKRNRKIPFFYKHGLQNIRYLDKTIANAFHIDFLNRYFPDAIYIFLVRHPYPNISSMIEGWGNENFIKPQLRKYIEGYNNSRISKWTYPAPKGWIDMINKDIPEICAWSWKMHVESAIKGFNDNKISPIVIHYEDLINNSLLIIRDISEKINVKFLDEYNEYFLNPPLSWTTITKPDEKKWKKYLPKLEKLNHYTIETAQKIGYVL